MNQIIVTETSSNIRALARVALKGNWKLVVIATAVYMVALTVPATILDLIFGGPDGISMLSGVYTCIVAGPFTIGYSLFCLNIFRQKDSEIAQVFYGFESFVKAIGLYFVMVIFITLWTLLLVVPGIIAAFRYSQCFLIMVDHPEYGIMQCLAESKRIMTGNKMKYFCMEISFLGWAVLAAIPTGIVAGLFMFADPIVISIGSLIASIAYFWLTPYMCVAGVAFYELATGNLKPGVIEVQPISINNNQEATMSVQKEVVAPIYQEQKSETPTVEQLKADVPKDEKQETEAPKAKI